LFLENCPKAEASVSFTGGGGYEMKEKAVGFIGAALQQKTLVCRWGGLAQASSWDAAETG
jgi:hypothetical protein